MSNILSIGCKIRRADGTTDEYFGWSYEEVKDFLYRFAHPEDSSSAVPELLCKIYKVENCFTWWEYDATSRVFREYTPLKDEIYETCSAKVTAAHLWELAVNSDEEDVRAITLIAIDIFGDYRTWRDTALLHLLDEFNRDEKFIEEARRN